MSWDMFSQSEESTFLVMVKINLTAACSWADIGSLLFFFYLSILKRSMVPCFGLPQKRGDSLNNRFKTDTSHFSSFALNFSFQRVQTCYRERDFRKQVEDCGEESCLRSIGTPFTLYPQHRLTSVFQGKHSSWRLLLQYHKTSVEVEFRELLFEIGKHGERQRSTTENKSTCYERLKKGTWATLVGEERSLPFWQKLRCFTTNIIKWHWLKIKILQHFNPEQEVSLFSFRYVAVKKIMRGFFGLCTQIHSLAVEWDWAHRPGLEFGRTEQTISFRGEYQITSVIRIS